MADEEKTQREMMQAALAVNGLSTGGSTEDMVKRLLNAGKRGKPGPKPKKAKTAANTLIMNDANVNKEEKEKDEYYRTERPKLAAQGITGYAKQNAELDRRWKVISTCKSTETPPKKQTAENVLRADEQLEDDMLAQLGMTKMGTEHTADGRIQYLYQQQSASRTAAASASASPAASADKKKKRDSSKEKEKCKKMDAPEDDFESTRDTVVTRIQENFDKSLVEQCLETFGVAADGRSKRALVEDLAEQLTCETDSDDDGDSDDE